MAGPPTQAASSNLHGEPVFFMLQKRGCDLRWWEDRFL